MQTIASGEAAAGRQKIRFREKGRAISKTVSRKNIPSPHGSGSRVAFSPRILSLLSAAFPFLSSSHCATFITQPQPCRDLHPPHSLPWWNIRNRRKSIKTIWWKFFRRPSPECGLIWSAPFFTVFQISLAREGRRQIRPFSKTETSLVDPRLCSMGQHRGGVTQFQPKGRHTLHTHFATGNEEEREKFPSLFYLSDAAAAAATAAALSSRT